VTQVEVDRERCLGTGSCEALAPDLFEVGDDGIVELLAQPEDEQARALVADAVQACPTRALSLAD
jgi:ferredoxin